MGQVTPCSGDHNPTDGKRVTPRTGAAYSPEANAICANAARAPAAPPPSHKWAKRRNVDTGRVE